MKEYVVEKLFHLKKIVDNALSKCPNVKKCLVVKRTGNNIINWVKGRDEYYNDIISVGGYKL